MQHDVSRWFDPTYKKAVRIYRFQKHNLVIQGERDDLIHLAELLRDAEGTIGDLRYQIERAFNIDGIKEVTHMKSAWFVVTCKVDSGCRIEKWQSIVYAPTLSQAKFKVYDYWKSQDSETTADILSARMLSEAEMIHMEVR